MHKKTGKNILTIENNNNKKAKTQIHRTQKKKT